VETINGRPGLRMAVRRRPKSVGAGLPYGRPIGHSPALCVTYSATAAIQLPLVALYKCYALTITGPNVPLWPITNSPYIHARRNVAAGKRIYSTQFPGAGDMTFVAGDRSLTTWYPVAAADIKIIITQCGTYREVLWGGRSLTVAGRRPQCLSGVLVTSCVMWHVTWRRYC